VTTVGQGIELLAPAGGPEAGLAAFEHGADAIYLGLQRFSARAEAENFSLDELAGIVGYAHGLSPRRRVLAAVNTLVLEEELAPAVEALGALADVGVDAVIVQDLGVARLVRRHFPSLRLHASTQLAVHSRAGVEALRSLGFARATLARELTLAEIRDAARAGGIEVEVFIHGALCYSYSGLCLYSSQQTGRSGNRGACAYPCRDRWQVGVGLEPNRSAEGRSSSGPLVRGHEPNRSAEGRSSSGPLVRGLERGADRPAESPPAGFAFSMKDLAAPDFVQALREAGVASLKIEGRKKSPLYVAATVSYYRALLDGGLGPAERAAHEQDIQSVFSRPWTALFLGGRHAQSGADRDFVGHRGARLGEVESVVRSGDELFVRFRSARALARHDGLQIDIPGLGHPFGFPVDVLRLAAPHRRARPREVAQAPAGSLVEVGLPDGYPTIPEGAPISCSSSQAVKQRYRLLARPDLAAHRARIGLRVKAALSERELTLEARAGEGSGEVLLRASLPGPFEPAQEPKGTFGALRAAFEKLGATRLVLERFDLEDPGGLFVPISRVNGVRRQLTAEVAQALRARAAERLAAIGVELARGEPAPGEDFSLRWSLKVDRISHLAELTPEDLVDVDEVLVEIHRDSDATLRAGLAPLEALLGRARIRLALPTITRAWEEPGLRGKIERLRAAGFSRWQASNVSAFCYLHSELDRLGPVDLSADASLHVLNRQAALQLREMGVSRVTLSVEDGLANMARLLPDLGTWATVVVYQDTPLFISESCPYAILKGGCPDPASDCRFESMELRSSHGGEVEAINDHCRTVVIGRRPFSLADRLEPLRHAGARQVRADFIHRSYTPFEVRDIWRALRAGRGVDRSHVANFDRGLSSPSPHDPLHDLSQRR
jgi:putative protease